MFRRLTIGCASGGSGQICRKLTTVANIASRSNNVASLCTVRDTRGKNLARNCLLYRCFPSIHQSDVSRYFASKAASKFGRKIKKESFDRYFGMDPSRLQYGYEEVSELEDVDGNVRRIFSLEFAPGKEIRKLQQEETIEGTEVDLADHSYTNFLVLSIARLTISIRNLAPHMERYPRDKKNKRLLLMMIDRRRKHIKLLRRINFDLANKLLEKLNLEFTPSPQYIRRVTKRALQKKLLCREAFEQRMKELEEFTGKLKEEQLQEIAELKKDLGMQLTDEETSRLQQDGE